MGPGRPDAGSAPSRRPRVGADIPRPGSPPMATFQNLGAANAASLASTDLASSPSRQAFQILKFGFTVAPIVAGLDKFFNLLVDWSQYVPAFVGNLVGGNAHGFMQVVGVIEIVAGLGVALKPRLFSY